MSKTLRELTLALATVTGDLYHVSGGDLLDKRITIDDITTAVRETLKGPIVADGNVTIETGGLLLARSNEDVIQEIGRVKVWGAGDIAYVSHYDFATAAGAGWQQNASGDTYLNAASGRTAGLRIANADILTVTGTLISLKKATTITGTLTADGNITQTAGNLVLLNGAADHDGEALQVAGAFYASSTGEFSSTVTVNSTGTTGQSFLGAGELQMGKDRTTDGLVSMRLIGDTTYSTYGFEISRLPGENGNTQLNHRGTGQYAFITQEESIFIFRALAGNNYLTMSNTDVTLGKRTTAAAGIKTDNMFIRTKVLDIGDWNMDTEASNNTAHGLTLPSIRSVNAYIRDDAGGIIPIVGTLFSPGLDGDLTVNTSNVVLTRLTGGYFDSINFNSTSYNRGYIVIEYEA